MPDLYQTLGVAPDATPEEIKRAGRRAQKQHHPDAGGDREKFDEAQKALTVLLDPLRRERYDRTGEAQEQSEESYETGEANALLAHVMAQVMAEMTDPARGDFVMAVTDKLLRQKGQFAEQRMMSERGRNAQLQKLEGFLKRLSFRVDSGGRMVQVLQSQIDAVERDSSRAIAKLEQQMRICDMTLELAKGHTYKSDGPARPMGMSGVMGPAGQFPTFFTNY